MAAGWDPGQGEYPLAPKNLQVVSPFLQGMWDLRWDDPQLQTANSVWTIVGVNIYRSDATDRGPYHRVNEFPVGGTFYRDANESIPVTEIVTWDRWVTRGDAPNDCRWVFRTQYPCVTSGSATAYANAATDVTVRVGGVVTPVSKVFGATGEITLLDMEFGDASTERFQRPPLPEGPETEVLVTYFRARNTVVTTGLDRKPFYRVTTVALHPDTPSGLAETPLEHSPPITPVAVETRTYIWTEAIRRNNWILEQGGERVKVFIRRVAGLRCWCGLDPVTRVFSKQPSGTCLKCYGTGLQGGYDGPYDIIIAPDDGERRVSQGPWGRRLEHQYEVWTGPSPMLTQRDFLVRQTNERYALGPIRRPSASGNILQQHFNISALDEADIRFRVPIDGTSDLAWPETRTTKDPNAPYPVGADRQATPMGTDKADAPDGWQNRGRTPVWENIEM